MCGERRINRRPAILPAGGIKFPLFRSGVSIDPIASLRASEREKERNGVPAIQGDRRFYAATWRSYSRSDPVAKILAVDQVGHNTDPGRNPLRRYTAARNIVRSVLVVLFILLETERDEIQSSITRLPSTSVSHFNSQSSISSLETLDCRLCEMHARCSVRVYAM